MKIIMIDDGVSYICNKYSLETTSEPCGRFVCCEDCSFDDKMGNLEKVSGGVTTKIKKEDVESMEKVNKKITSKEKWNEPIKAEVDIKKPKAELAKNILDEQAKKTPKKRGKYKKKTDGVVCDCKKHIIIEDTQIEESKECDIPDGIKRFMRVEKVVRVLEEVRNESSSDEMDAIALLKMAAQIVFPYEVDILRMDEIESVKK